MRWNSSWNGRVILAAASILSALAKCVLISARSAPPENTLRALRICRTLQSVRVAKPSRMPWKASEHVGIEGIDRRPVERHRGDAVGDAQTDAVSHSVASSPGGLVHAGSIRHRRGCG